MQYNYTKVQEHFPKNTRRSNRTLKKLHLGTYAVSLASINIPIALFDFPTDVVDKCLDIIYEHDDGCFVIGATNGFTILHEFESKLDDCSTKTYLQNFIEKIICELSNTEMEFANVQSISIEFGDAYYGEW